MKDINQTRGNAVVMGLIILAVLIGGYFTLRGNGEDSSGAEQTDVAQEEEKNIENKIPEGAMMEDGTIIKDGDTTSNQDIAEKKSGSFESYAPEKLVLAENGDVVLFFHASWCPYCRAAENDINQNLSQIPSGVHILKTNYDTETALKQKYGVTYQHTFVQVDASGNLIKKWSGSETLSEIIANIQ